MIGAKKLYIRDWIATRNEVDEIINLMVFVRAGYLECELNVDEDFFLVTSDSYIPDSVLGEYVDYDASSLEIDLSGYNLPFCIFCHGIAWRS